MVPYPAVGSLVWPSAVNLCLLYSNLICCSSGSVYCLRRNAGSFILAAQKHLIYGVLQISTYTTFSLAVQMSTSQLHFHLEARRWSEMCVHVPPSLFQCTVCKAAALLFPFWAETAPWMLSGSEACVQGCSVYLAQLSNGYLEYHKVMKIQLPIYVFTWYKCLMDRFGFSRNKIRLSSLTGRAEREHSLEGSLRDLPLTQADPGNLLVQLSCKGEKAC